MAFFEKLNDFLWGPPLIILMVGTGLFFSIKTRFFQFRYFGHIMKNTFGKMGKKDENSGHGMISSFEAICIAIGGSVGVANIGGVATAVAVGGPGAIFWMWFAALLGMLLKLVEVTLGVYYRETDEKGLPFGGPTYYMAKGLGEERGFKGWKVLAIIFGAGIFSTFFITLQNYTISEAIGNTFGINMLYVSILYIVCVYLLISGGIPQLGAVSVKLVPFMLMFYLLGGVFIILKNITQLPYAFGLIFSGAFSGSAAVGGFAGATFAKALQTGMARSVYSNEAGWGTSPMIHSTARTNHPVKQGLFGAFEVFVDTLVVCTITGLIVTITGGWLSGLDGATMALSVFEAEVGRFGRIIVALSIFLLGLTSSTGWYSYYEVILRHLMGKESKAKDTILKIYKWVYPLPELIFPVLAVTRGLPGSTVWLFADLVSAVPTFINVFVVLALSPTFFKLLDDYKARYLGIGKVDPNMVLFYEDKKKKARA